MKSLPKVLLVHYVMPSNGECRPAIVVNGFGKDEGYAEPVVNLQVFTDSDEQGNYNDRVPAPYWVTSVAEDKKEATFNTWHDANNCPHDSKKKATVESVEKVSTPPVKKDEGKKEKENK